MMKKRSRHGLLFAVMSLATGVSAQGIDATKSPHGPAMKRDCRLCHNTKDWTVDAGTVRFSHQDTEFPLTEAHEKVRCRACHVNLEFNRVGRSCSDCHTDFHQGRMGKDCEYCHTAGNWEDRRKVRENHARTLFPLIGAHAAAECEDCHGSAGRLGFAGASTACVSCHQEDFNRTADPDHRKAAFSEKCTDCHSGDAVTWKGAVYRHPGSFQLTQGHAGLRCRDCHERAYAGTPVDCWSCHTADYNRAADPSHVTNQFDHDCQKCHTRTAWTPSTFDHNATGFPLTGAHKTTSCIACHPNNRYAGTPKDCWSCHASDYNRVTEPSHIANQFDHDCLKCHTQTAWTPSTFDHNATGFPLTGAHKTTSCIACHPNNRYAGTPKDCWSCHASDYNRVAEPSHVTNQFDHDCLKCHTQTAWTPSTFDHNATGFPLTGAHKTTSCIACHPNNRYVGTPKDCWSCHASDYNRVAEPSHVTNQFDHDCLKCHTQTAWTPSTFDHNATGFPLTGAHKTTSCIACHPNNRYAGTPTDCWSCHTEDYNRVTEPSHIANQFDHDCLKCHTQTAWTPSTFDHNATSFPLTGAHKTTSCIACHPNNRYTGTPKDCWSCHMEDYNRVTEPSHIANQFDHDCLKCHTQTAWTPSTFDHNATSFPLTGAHKTTSCIACHPNNRYAGTPTDCWSCHMEDYNRVTEPSHIANQFDHDCLKCHTQTTWTPATYDHNTTAFPLTGAHRTTSCIACHPNNRYAGTPTDCWSCHTADYNGVTDPNHIANQFDHDCLKCHTQTTWTPATYDHNTTAFPLTGAHRTTSCIACHPNSRYAGTPKDCWSCHTADYNGVTDPNHIANQFDHDCLKCHTQTAWTPATFDHNTTAFPLTGAHRTTSCIACHPNSRYAGTPKDCWSCHTADYNGVTDPNHIANQFDHDCLKCHTQTAWTPATFDHNTTAFPLTGAHVAVSCQGCHSNGYSGTPRDCAFCHETDYDRTTDPNHKAAGFPLTCQTCHTTIRWTGASFNHDASYFPIYSGSHARRWSACSDCHTNSSNYAVFACTNCHAHSQSEMNDSHDDVGGYRFNSADCYRCHPRGVH